MEDEEEGEQNGETTNQPTVAVSNVLSNYISSLLLTVNLLAIDYLFIVVIVPLAQQGDSNSCIVS